VQAVAGRGVRGRTDHLLPLIRDRMQISHLDGFGSVTDRHRLTECMAGRVVLQGGPGHEKLFAAPHEAAIAECLSYIRTVGRYGGFILQPGGPAPPGTPPDRYDVLVEASMRAAE
jgi:uroporphyrinogen-III decarboxylase